MFKFTITFLLLLISFIMIKKYKDYYKDDDVELPNEYIAY